MLAGAAILAALSFACGSGLAWVLWVGRGRTAAEAALRDAEARARGAASAAEELRLQLRAATDRAEALQADIRGLEAARAAAEVQVVGLERSLAEQRELLGAAKEELATTFHAAAAEALRRNNEGFLQLASEKLAAARQEGASALAAREQSIAALVTPMQQSLEKVDAHIQELERARGEAYVRLMDQVRSLAEGHEKLRCETGNLVSALRAPAVRGRWGEIQLRRVVELVGMVEHCDFVEQATTTTEDGRLRPDMVIRLPSGRRVVVDAKAPLAAYLAAWEATSDEQRAGLLRQHAAQVKAHVLKLGAKGYWAQFTPSPDLVVMFLPGEAFYGAALEHNPALIEEAYASRVLLATPTTLIGLLQAIHHGWAQERLAVNAEEISRCGRELHERIATLTDHFSSMGGALGRAVEAFNRTVASFETRVLPGARRLEDLGARGKKELPELDPIDRRPRPLAGTDRGSGGGLGLPTGTADIVSIAKIQTFGT